MSILLRILKNFSYEGLIDYLPKWTLKKDEWEDLNLNIKNKNKMNGCDLLKQSEKVGTELPSYNYVLSEFREKG